MLVDGKPSTGVFTDSEAPEIDKAQYESEQGPCLDAFRTQRVYRIESTATDLWWPHFVRGARNMASRQLSYTRSRLGRRAWER